MSTPKLSYRLSLLNAFTFRVESLPLHCVTMPFTTDTDDDDQSCEIIVLLGWLPAARWRYRCWLLLQMILNFFTVDRCELS